VECITIGMATLYHADMMEVLPTLPRADLVIADPPYGIGETNGKKKRRSKAFGSSSFSAHNTRRRVIEAPEYDHQDWDTSPAAPEEIAATIAAGKHCIIWGGNYFHLPPAKGWLVWDKINSGDFADCELAWSNLPSAVRLFRHMWNGMLRDSEKNEPRCHATQKPIVLMKWCIQRVKETPKLVIDPYMDSAPVGIACADMGIQYIGVERDKRNFDIACARIERANQQLKLAL
jgi:DNA modification methylase